MSKEKVVVVEIEAGCIERFIHLIDNFNHIKNFGDPSVKARITEVKSKKPIK